jgi:cytoskeletal protein RodZ
MPAFEETSDQPRAALPRGPVFVDDSGRRFRRVKLLGLGALGLVAGYVVLLLVALVGGSNIAAPYLPLPGAPMAADLPSSPPAPVSDAAGHEASEAPSNEPASAAEVTVPAPVTVPSAVPVAQPAESTERQPAAHAASDAASTDLTAPGMSEAAPGQTTRPTAPPHP